MTKDFNFIDDPTVAATRIAEQEARLGLPKSEARIDLIEANAVLRGLELTPTPTRPAVQPATPPATTATVRQPTAQAAASHQPNAAPVFPKDGKLHGVALLTAFYARHA